MDTIHTDSYGLYASIAVVVEAISKYLALCQLS